VTLHQGRVIAFDEGRGLGEVQDDADAAVYRFHCTQIVDGTRTIPLGAVVVFELFEHPIGGTEATAIERR
jgi:cold shock CspA family protein